MHRTIVHPARRPGRLPTVIVAGLVAGGMILAACGGSEGGLSSGEADEAAATLPAEVQDLYRDAVDEGELLLYTGRPTQMVADLAAEFNELYPGIRVEAVQGRGRENAQRLLTEYEAGAVAADVIEAGAPDYYGILTHDLVEPCGAEAEYDDPELIDPDGLWNVTSAVVYFTAFNSDLVSDDVVPTSFDDLVDPKFEGKIMATDYLGPWQALRYGRFDGEIEATKAYFEKLRDNGLQIFTGSSPQAAELLASGQRPIYAWANDVDIADLSSAGAPVGKVTDEAVVALYLSGCVVDAPHPAGAKLWNQWILSEAGQQAQANVGMALVHPTVQGSIDVSQIKTPYYVRPEYAADTDADLAAYNTIFGLS